MFRLNEGTQLTPAMILRYIEINSAEESRREKLYNYYKGQHNILKRVMKDACKPNNKVVNPYCHYITDMMTGYFMGEPIAYQSDNNAFLTAVKQTFKYNDEQAENTDLAKDASICGEAYELLYIDEDGEVRFKRLEPIRCIPIYDNTIEEELLYFIRYYYDTDILSGNTTTFVEVYSRSDYKLYEKALGSLELIASKPHIYKAVPIVVYKNNEEQLGDFELVIPLVDAYDKITSDNVNDLEYFVDSYLCLSGMMGTEPSDIAAMKENRVILLPDAESKAEWLVKSVNDAYIENLKTRIDNDIHKSAFCPNMTDKDFAANASGVSMRYKLLGLEQATSKKESAFKKGIQRRLELICNVFYVYGKEYDYRDIEIIFNRNIPVNMTEQAEIIDKLHGVLSNETLVSLLPLDIDYSAEKERLNNEKEYGYELLGDQNFTELEESAETGSNPIEAAE